MSGAEWYVIGTGEGRYVQQLGAAALAAIRTGVQGPYPSEQAATAALQASRSRDGVRRYDDPRASH